MDIILQWMRWFSLASFPDPGLASHCLQYSKQNHAASDRKLVQGLGMRLGSHQISYFTHFTTASLTSHTPLWNWVWKVNYFPGCTSLLLSSLLYSLTPSLPHSFIFTSSLLHLHFPPSLLTLTSIPPLLHSLTPPPSPVTSSKLHSLQNVCVYLYY